MRFLKVVRGNRIVFLLAGGFALSVLLISEGSYRQSVGRLDAVPAMSQARNSIQNLVDGVVNAETSERGYLVTGRKEYREPYDDAIKKVSDALQYLGPYYQNKPEAAQILSRLKTATETKLSELALTIQLIDEGKPEAGIAYTAAFAEQLRGSGGAEVSFYSFENESHASTYAPALMKACSILCPPPPAAHAP